ncbi:hypothetical protein GCM10007906_45060 [Vibrio hyugaensis]|uniref:Uncharacterized protein n=1 Tax=Vibrio hyugaensis TaxID=1534743 RepID=A0ABQ5Y7G9_9VIBR|nr:hypothetical protein GCM10007906_45060 [Vibrio hyugaensis]
MKGEPILVSLIVEAFNVLITAVATMAQSTRGSGDYLYLPNKGLAKTWHKSHLSFMVLSFISLG